MNTPVGSDGDGRAVSVGSVRLAPAVGAVSAPEAAATREPDREDSESEFHAQDSGQDVRNVTPRGADLRARGQGPEGSGTKGGAGKGKQRPDKGEGKRGPGAACEQDGYTIVNKRRRAGPPAYEGKGGPRDQDREWDRNGFPILRGDWLCDQCGDHQFASRVRCRKCDAPKVVRRDQGASGRSRSTVGKGGKPRAMSPTRRGMSVDPRRLGPRGVRSGSASSRESEGSSRSGSTGRLPTPPIRWTTVRGRSLHPRRNTPPGNVSAGGGRGALLQGNGAGSSGWNPSPEEGLAPQPGTVLAVGPVPDPVSTPRDDTAAAPDGSKEVEEDLPAGARAQGEESDAGMRSGRRRSDSDGSVVSNRDNPRSGLA